MTKTRARALLAAIPLILVLGLTGCSSDGGDNNGVASAGGDSTNSGDDSGGGGNEPLSEDEEHEQMLDYAQCLRDHGVDVEDPAPGEGIQLQLDGGPHQADAALEACKDLLPPAPAGPEEDAGAREDMLDYAQCMRDNGVEQFADPQPGAGINIGPDVVEDPDYEAAEQTCGELFGGGVAPDEGEQLRSMS